MSTELLSTLKRGDQPFLFARARYPNQADAEDELTFRKDEILQVLQKDYNGQVDWWLCRLGKKVGMVPANYLEIFHSHTTKEDIPPKIPTKEKADLDKSVYDFPKPKTKPSALAGPSTTPAAPSTAPGRLLDDPRYADYDFPTNNAPLYQEDEIYDIPPQDEDEPDYDLPPVEVSAADTGDLYDRPPSNKSSHTLQSNRISNVSTGSQVYDIPPTSPSAVYNVPPLEFNTPGDSIKRQGSRPGSGEGMDLSNMYENEAEEFLKKHQTDVEKKFDQFWQCVYGSNAYWGSDNKLRRKETLMRTISAAKEFSECVSTLVEFGKGVATSLENTKDVNFKRKITAANSALVAKKQEMVVKLDILVDADEKDVPITATVKSLLEGARTIPQAVQALILLVQVNKAVLFKTSIKSEDSLPVLTKSEVKNRPLPDIPDARNTRLSSAGDYADISTEGDIDVTESSSSKNTLDTSTSRRRNPQDTLPPLPFATLKKPKQKKPLPPPIAANDDYDDIDGLPTNYNIPPPPIPARTDNQRTENHLNVSPNNSLRTRNHYTRQSSGSNHSNSSDGGTCSPRRSRSPDPYGIRLINGGSDSPSQPLKHEDKELLTRYGQQMELLVPGLKDAIESFTECVKNNEPPKEFVSKSKLAVVAAYKLVYIADSLYQKLLHNDIKARIVASSNQLTDTIKSLVNDTKTAALQYPSVGSVQKMRESLKKLFPAALDLLTSVKFLN